MLYAKKDNKQIRITKDVQPDYEKQGFLIFEFDEKSKKKKIISKPVTALDLAKENKKLEATIKKLEAELATLKAPKE